MSKAATETFQPLEWPFPGYLPDVQAQTILSESSTSYLRSVHRQHQISHQKAQKRTKVSRSELDNAQLKLKRLRRERQALTDKRSQLARKTRALEPEIEAIDPCILQTKMSDTSEEPTLPKGLTIEHQVLFARLEREIEVVQSKEQSLRDLEAELSDLKKSIIDVRHCAIIADGSLGELDKVVQTVTERLQEAVTAAGGSDATSTLGFDDTDIPAPSLGED